MKNNLNYFTILFAHLAAVTLIFTGCVKNDNIGGADSGLFKGLPQGGGTGAGGGSGSVGDPTKAGGGVDVGNMTTYLVPTSEVAMSAGAEWKRTEDKSRLELKTKDNSSITGQVTTLPGVTASTVKAVELYLREKNPSKEIRSVNMNGVPALEVKAAESKTELKSDFYIVEEGKGIVLIQADLKGDSLQSGKEVLESTRIIYQGKVIPGQSSKTITLDLRTHASPNNRYAYNLKDECSPWTEEKCGNGVAFGVSNYNDRLRLEIGLGGYDSGRIVELGPESQVPYDSVRVDGAYLVAKGKNLPLSDIYTLFTPNDLNPMRRDIQPKEGMVYLFRTISWPDEDIVAKVRIDAITTNSVTLTYEKLTEIPEEILKKKVDEAIAYTRKNEMPNERGEVVLYSRSVYRAYPYASFNFEYSNSGNAWITRNGWQLMFENGGDGKPVIYSIRTGSAVVRMHLSSKSDLGMLDASDFPDMNLATPRGFPAVKGGVYLIDQYDFSTENNHIRGAVKVLDLDPSGAWVRLEFRRIFVGRTSDQVKWQPVPVDPSTKTVALEFEANYHKARYSPLLRNRSDEGYDSETMDAYSQAGDVKVGLYVDSRPYRERGFVRIDSQLFESVNSESAAKILAQQSTENRVNVQTGEVYLVNLKGYYNHLVLAVRIEEVVAGKSVKVSVRDIYKAKAPFEDR